jgi:hyperosmotically inducible periplasmic protein
MRTQWLFVATTFAVLTGLGLSSGVYADSADDTVEDRIEARLKASKLGHVDVEVEKGIATLKGEVATAGEKARAARLAKVKGVTTVTNELAIDADKAKARIEERAEAAKEKIDKSAEAAKGRVEAGQEGAEKRAEAAKESTEKQAEAKKEAVDRKTETAKEHVEKTGRLPPPTETGRANEKVDPLITAKVKMKFAGDELVKAHQINVDSERDGVVTLRGTVPSETAHKRALELAKGTDGVRQVNDLLKVAPETK